MQQENRDPGITEQANGGTVANNRKCVIGESFQVECHTSGNSVYVLLQDLPVQDRENIRSKITSGSESCLCQYHVGVLTTTSRHPSKVCPGYCDITHKRSSKAVGLSAFTYFNRLNGNTQNLFPGSPVCSKCRDRAIEIHLKPPSAQYEVDMDYEPPKPKYSDFNKILEAAVINPFVPQKLTLLSQKNAIVAKMKALIGVCFEILANDGIEIDQGDIYDEVSEWKKKSESFDCVMNDLKEKYETSDYRRKIQVLTLAPSNWTLTETETFFTTENVKCPKSQVRKARKLKDLFGPLALAEPRVRRGLDWATVKRVTDHYYDDMNSRVFPGMNDTVGVKENGVKVRKSKRLILMNLKELYRKFQLEHGDKHKIGFAKFCYLRPREMVLSNARGVHNVCVCTYHGNVNLMLEAILQPKAFRTELMNSIVCEYADGEERRDSCMLGTCKDCSRPNPEKKARFQRMVLQKLEAKGKQSVTYSQWTTKEQRAGLQTITASREEYIESLYDLFVSLLPHHYISGTQAAKFKKMRDVSFLGTNKAVIQVDFGENYDPIVQDAPQSFHWETTQVTIHPIVAWIGSGESVKCVSAAALSDERRHDTESFFAYLKVFMEWFLKENPNITHIEYWSDGCGGQYKNCKNFDNLLHHFKDFNGVTASWNFFATSHGKGAVDGISGQIKSSARRFSMTAINEGHILGAQELFEHCESKIPKIKFFLVTAEDVATISDTCDIQNRFNAAKTYPETRKCHRVEVIGNTLFMYRTSEDLTPFYTSSTKSVKNVVQISLGDWLGVRYLSTWYLGQVVGQNEESGLTHVHYVEHPGSSPSFKFSGNAELNSCWIDSSAILAKVSPYPGKTGRTRSHFFLTTEDRSAIETAFLFS